MQLLGGKVLSNLGYEVTISNAGAKFYNPCSTVNQEAVGPFLAPWKNDLIYIDIRNFPEFWLGKFKHYYQPKGLEQAAMISTVSDRSGDRSHF